MGYSEPYSGLLTGVATRLVNAAGPFTTADQVKVWIDEALDELGPSEALQGELARSVPIALVCDGGNGVGDEDADAVEDLQRVHVWFCSQAPTMAAAVTGDGDEYWGCCAIKHWVFTRLSDRSWAATGWEPLQLIEMRPVAVPRLGQVMFRAVFETRRCQEV